MIEKEAGSMTRIDLAANYPWLVAGAVAGLALGLLLWLIFLPRAESEVEHPRRLDMFVASLRDCDWNESGNRLAAMERLFEGLVALTAAEVSYYYRSRRARRRVSFIFRWIGYLFGSAGIIFPLLTGLLAARQDGTGLGYVLLAVAAAAFAGNQLFGGTQGHVRYVTAQYVLERLITEFEL